MRGREGAGTHHHSDVAGGVQSPNGSRLTTQRVRRPGTGANGNTEGGGGEEERVQGGMNGGYVSPVMTNGRGKRRAAAQFGVQSSKRQRVGQRQMLEELGELLEEVEGEEVEEQTEREAYDEREEEDKEESDGTDVFEDEDEFSSDDDEDGDEDDEGDDDYLMERAKKRAGSAKKDESLQTRRAHLTPSHQRQQRALGRDKQGSSAGRGGERGRGTGKRVQAGKKSAQSSAPLRIMQSPLVPCSAGRGSRRHGLPASWLCVDKAVEGAPYLPQVGDEVAYFYEVSGKETSGESRGIRASY